MDTSYGVETQLIALSLPFCYFRSHDRETLSVLPWEPNAMPGTREPQ